MKKAFKLFTSGDTRPRYFETPREVQAADSRFYSISVDELKIGQSRTAINDDLSVTFVERIPVPVASNSHLVTEHICLNQIDLKIRQYSDGRFISSSKYEILIHDSAIRVERYTTSGAVRAMVAAGVEFPNRIVTMPQQLPTGEYVIYILEKGHAPD